MILPYLPNKNGVTQKSVASAAKIDAATFDPRLTNMARANTGNAAQRIVRKDAIEAHADEAYTVYESTR